METNISYKDSVFSDFSKITPQVFKNFSPEDLRGILSAGRYEELDANVSLSGDNGKKSLEGYLVLEGRLAAYRNGMIIEEYNPGDFIGVAFLHSRVLVECELTTTEPVRLLAFDREQTLYFFRDKPEKLLKIFTINVVEAQQKHICSLYKRISSLMQITDID